MKALNRISLIGLLAMDRRYFDAPSAKPLGRRQAEQVLALQKKAK